MAIEYEVEAETQAEREITLTTLNTAQLLEQQCAQCPDKEAVLSKWQGVSLTYETLYKTTREIAATLLRHGVRPGDRIVVLAGNSLEYVQLFFAVSAIGAIFTIINPTFTPDEIIPTIEFVEPTAIFVADRIGYRKYGPLIADIAKKRQSASLVVQLGSSPTVDGVRSWEEFLHPDQEGGAVQDPSIVSSYWGRSNPNDPMCIQFTSGTTGARKAAMLSHSNLLNNALLVGHRLRLISEDKILCCSPVFHCFGLVCGVLAAIIYGGTAVLPSDVFVAEASLRALSEDQCTVVHGVATMFQAMLDHPEAGKHAPHVRLRTGIIAGSSLSPALLARLESVFGFTGLAYGYGMTELSCIVFLTDPNEVSLVKEHTSVGKVMPLTAARVVDENLKTLPPGTAGELLVSGYLVFQGYYKNPEKTAEALVKDSEGRVWLRTGDLVTIDQAGRCTITGRVKDMIKRGGENIFPGDIEPILESHPDITACAIVGVPDSYWGEIIVAFIQGTKEAKCGPTLRKKALKLWLRHRLAPHKVPEHFFVLGSGGDVPDEMPINATGKVLKRELRDIASCLLQGAGV
ncbi:class I adenylate-forming enzyme family protein [Aspergillus mulundensis]|uniref:Uncharacterized protein n=1 Tax=Aspergillus mulundensis TaxID=1810919 RepID=A0A3D8SDG5_9EURO|nr:Uncharacterized protein DSM5745_04537 [Aspergillus mulundensis]RDW84211.1 Uncharacterized protein DSM5745_04537 [Aspergillus mulundensis]